MLKNKLFLILVASSAIILFSGITKAYFTGSLTSPDVKLSYIPTVTATATATTTVTASPTQTPSPTPSPTATATSCEQVVINEYMADPEGVQDSKGEWFELYNPCDTTIDLNGWRYRNIGMGNIVPITTSVTISSHGYKVFGKSDNSSENGNISNVYELGTGFNINNNGDSIVMERPDGSGGYIEVDKVDFRDDDIWPITSGRSNMLKGPALDNSDVSNWKQTDVNALNIYYQIHIHPHTYINYGTPGGSNV